MELRKGNTKVWKQEADSPYLFEISNYKLNRYFREFNKFFS